MNRIRFAVNKSGRARLFRNNVGLYYTKLGIPTRCGLATGSADLIGFTMPGGKFLSIEVKTPTGRIEKEQQLWCDFINKHGGHATICRSVQEAISFINAIS